jgi:riboflavin transporter FmnP
MENKNSTARLTGTAILAALVIVFDYSLKYSGLKIPFPWYPNLKFDFTGIPIIMSLLMYGFPSALTTSMVAGLGIVVRSGNVVSASMKTFAELSTVIGLHLGSKIAFKEKGGSGSIYVVWVVGVISRVVIMSVVNLYVLPNVWRVPLDVTIGLLPLIGIFNVLQGILTIILGYYLYKAVKTRLPNWYED